MWNLPRLGIKPLSPTLVGGFLPLYHHRSPTQGIIKREIIVLWGDFSNYSFQWKLLSRVQLFATPWTIQSMDFFRPEYWSGLPFSSPGDLPNPGIESRSPTLQADSLPAEPPGKSKNTEVGTLSLFQWIFLTQESKQGSCIAGRFFTSWATGEVLSAFIACPSCIFWCHYKVEYRPEIGSVISVPLILFKKHKTCTTWKTAVRKHKANSLKVRSV